MRYTTAKKLMYSVATLSIVFGFLMCLKDDLDPNIKSCGNHGMMFALKNYQHCTNTIGSTSMSVGYLLFVLLSLIELADAAMVYNGGNPDTLVIDF